MIPIIITVASFSFQISGAIILLLWSLRKCDNKVKKMCLEHNLQWLDFEGNATISREKIQANAKTVYLNICAFIDILLGYGCAIFIENLELNKFYIFLLIIGITSVIIIFEKILVNCIAKIKYPKDQKVNYDNLFS